MLDKATRHAMSVRAAALHPAELPGYRPADERDGEARGSGGGARGCAPEQHDDGAGEFGDGRGEGACSPHFSVTSLRKAAPSDSRETADALARRA